MGFLDNRNNIFEHSNRGLTRAPGAVAATSTGSQRPLKRTSTREIMGGAASASAVLAGKPLDGSDVLNLEQGRAEIARIRRALAEGGRGGPGFVVDCGSGHSNIMLYSRSGGSGPRLAHQLARTRLSSAANASMKLDEMLSTEQGAGEGDMAARIGAFVDAIEAATKSALQEHTALVQCGNSTALWRPPLLLVGATGGCRDAMESGRVTAATVDALSRALQARLGDRMEVSFQCVHGDDEARWELDAAQEIWGGDAAAMFGDAHASAPIGILSGGGQSMQVAAPAAAETAGQRFPQPPTCAQPLRGRISSLRSVCGTPAKRRLGET